VPATSPTARTATEPATGPTTIAFLVVRQFSLISLVSALEPLRGANCALGREAYAWKLYSPDGAPIAASNGIVVSVDGELDDLAAALPATDILFVVAGLDPDPPGRAHLHAVLSRAARAGVVLGSLSSGTFILARAGLLDGYRCTVHWEFQPAFEEAFPEIECSSGLYVVDRDRWTGSGGITGLDLMLGLVERDHGPELSREVGNLFQIDRIRNAGVDQRPGALARLETLPAPLQTAVSLMLSNMEEPLRMQEIARRSGLNLRRMERLFRAHLDAPPGQVYRRLRLERARELLRHTNLATLEVGMLTGFSSSSHFAMAYQREFGQRPSETRRIDEAGTAEGAG